MSHLDILNMNNYDRVEQDLVQEACNPCCSEGRISRIACSRCVLTNTSTSIAQKTQQDLSQSKNKQRAEDVTQL